MFREIRPGDAWLAGRRPFVHLLAEAAAALGGRLELEATFGHVGRYRAPSGEVRPIFGNALGCNADAAAMLAADKDYTARALAAAGLPAPEGRLFVSPAFAARMRLKNAAVADALPAPEAAAAAAAALGFPVVLKPNSGSEGRGVHVAGDAADVRADLETLFRTDDRVRLEAFLPGEDVRVTVLDGQVRLAYRRRVPTLTGDGRQSVGALLEAALADLAARHRGPKLAATDPRIARALAAQGLSLADVPPPGATVTVLRSANLSAGGVPEDLSGGLPDRAGALALRAAEVTNLRLAGIDLRSPDILARPDQASILEVNASPGLDFYASHGAAQRKHALALVIDALR